MSLKRESSLPTSFSFESKNELIQLPSVAIVIPTLNRYDYLKNTLSDLSLQDYKNFQVVVVDQSDNFNQFFYSQFKFPITVIRQPTKGLCQARNTAINSVQSDFYLLFDDDSRVNPDWISQHLISFFNFKFDISSGASPRLEEFDSKNFVNYYRYSDVLDTGNCLIPRYVFKKIGLLDLRYERQIREDSDLGFRALLNGFVILHNPRALRVHLKASTGGLRQFGSIDGFKINRVFSAKPHPSVFLYSWFYFGIKTLFYEFFISIYRFYSPFYNGNNIYARIFINTPFYVLQTPILFFQVLYSFILAVKMKFSNPLIPLLK
jgi:glycosyltransferase involved in cell wall biosynthesis